MKNKLLLLILSVIFTISCKNSDSTGKAGESIMNSITGKNTAGQVISYYNTFIDYDTNASKKLNDFFKRDFESLSGMVKNKKKTSRLIVWTSFIGIDPRLETWSGSKKVNLLKPEALLDKTLAEKVRPLVEKMQDAYKKTKEGYLDFKKYYKNEDYKDDAWAKGGEYLKIMEDNANAYFDNKNKFFTLFSSTIDKAEEDILADHPIRDEIIHAKRTLKLVDQISVLISNEKINITDIEEAYKKLEERLKDSRDMDLTKLKAQNKDTKFSDFYDEIDDMLGVMRKTKRDGAISKRDAKDIYYEYSSVVGDYNRFVK